MNNATITEPQPPKAEKRTIGVALPTYTRIGELAAQNRTHRGEMVELLLALWEGASDEAKRDVILGRVGL